MGGGTRMTCSAATVSTTARCEPTYLGWRARSSSCQAPLSQPWARDPVLSVPNDSRFYGWRPVAAQERRGVVWAPDRRHPVPGADGPLAANRGRVIGELGPRRTVC